MRKSTAFPQLPPVINSEIDKIQHRVRRLVVERRNRDFVQVAGDADDGVHIITGPIVFAIDR
jgi:hypothetical protein